MEPYEIVELLEALGLGKTFDAAILRQLLARRFGRDLSAESFIISKLDTLKAHVAASRTDPPTLDHDRTIIEAWLKEEDALGAICEKYVACDQACESCMDEARGTIVP
jgi:hypothetical protein